MHPKTVAVLSRGNWPAQLDNKPFTLGMLYNSFPEHKISISFNRNMCMGNSSIPQSLISSHMMKFLNYGEFPISESLFGPMCLNY